VSGTILTIRPSLVVSLSMTTANDDGSGDYTHLFRVLKQPKNNSCVYRMKVAVKLIFTRSRVQSLIAYIQL